MKIIQENPPNLEAIKEAGLNPSEYTVFSYGDILYNPGGWSIPEHLMEHEETHGIRQTFDPNGIEGWWDKYLKDEEFRLNEELLAYQAQYHFFCKKKKNVRKQREFLYVLALECSSDLYGRMISFKEAMELIEKKYEN